MAGLPVYFQSLSNVLPTYDYIDIAAGTGIINFYAGTTVDAKLLSNKEFYSDEIITTATTTSGSAVLILDVDFDVMLNRPLNLSGNVVLNVPVGIISQTSSPGTINTYIIAKVRKWDGSTETEICNNQSSIFSISSSSVPAYKMLAIDLNIPLTHFKIGEYLRLTIEQYTYGNGGTMGSGFAHDPMNRTGNWDGSGATPSKLVFQVPTRLNL